MADDAQPPPRKTFWPYAVTLALVIFGLAMIGLAIFVSGQRFHLVAPDYYARGMRHQEQIERVAQTGALASPPELLYDRESKRLTLTMPGDHVAAREGVLAFYRPSDASLDFEVPLALTDDGTQRIDLLEAAPGFWRVQLSWHLGEADYYHETSLVR